jgi:hypothetical protein
MEAEEEEELEKKKEHRKRKERNTKEATNFATVYTFKTPHYKGNLLHAVVIF